MVKLLVSFAVLSFIFSATASAESKRVKPKPVLAEMEGLFTLIQTLRKENSLLKDQLMNHEITETRTTASAMPVVTPSKKDPSVVLMDKNQYQSMVKEMERLKSQNVAKEKLILEMEEGL